MFSGPMFRREYHAATRKRRPFVLRSFIAAMLGIVALLSGLIAVTADSRVSAAQKPLVFGRAVFIATLYGELLVLVFVVPGLVAGSIAEERERNTLPLLLLTRLTPLEIVLTKTVARWLSTINLILTGVPILVASAWAAGLEVEMVLVLAVLASSSGFMATLAILASSARVQAASARAEALAWTLGWLIAAPILSIIPAARSTLWGTLLSDLKALCALVAPSSPFSLVTDPRWYTGAGASSLQERVAWMVGLQAMLGLLALGFAATRVKPRETGSRSSDPSRGYRPPCGDDPIFWREYELPMRGGSGPLIGTRLRYVLILIRAILRGLLGLLAMLLVLAVPIGLVVATLYFGFEAFQELRQYGYGPDGRFVKRMHFNLLVRAATALLALFPMFTLSSLVSGRIISERDRTTWDTLLTTPLSGEEILRSKALATLQGFRHTVLPLLPVIWALGLACGVVRPLGVLLAAIDLVLATWAFLALGLYLSLRPSTDREASSQITLSSLVLLVVHTAMVATVLASPVGFATFASWEPRVRWQLALACLAVPIVTGMMAWRLTRRTLDRFDEWVGRPVLRESSTDRAASTETRALAQ